MGAIITAASAKELVGGASAETEERLQRQLQGAEEGEANEEEGGECCQAPGLHARLQPLALPPAPAWPCLPL